MAHLPMLAGGTSLLPCGTGRSSSCPGVVDVAYQPAFAGGASRSPFGAGACVPHIAVDRVELALLAFDDIE